MKTSSTPKQRYLLRKYVYAESAAKALQLDKTTPVRDVVLQEATSEQVNTELIGFQLENEDED